MVKEGIKAPEFKLPSTEGRDIALKEFIGKQNVVLYFYPRDNTPGCTQESCDFRDNTNYFAQYNTVVLGVSGDNLKSHDSFREKFSLPFPLLTDDDKKIHKAYGAYGKKILYGKEIQGTIRSTVIIGKDGTVKKVFSPVKVEGHVDEVLSVVKNLS